MGRAPAREWGACGDTAHLPGAAGAALRVDRGEPEAGGTQVSMCWGPDHVSMGGRPRTHFLPTPVSTADAHAQASLVSPASSWEPRRAVGLCVSSGTERFSYNFAQSSCNSCSDCTENTSCYSRGSCCWSTFRPSVGFPRGGARVSQGLRPPIQGSGAASAPPQPPTFWQDRGQRPGPRRVLGSF